MDFWDQQEVALSECAQGGVEGVALSEVSVLTVFDKEHF